MGSRDLIARRHAQAAAFGFSCQNVSSLHWIAPKWLNGCVSLTNHNENVFDSENPNIFFIHGSVPLALALLVLNEELGTVSFGVDSTDWRWPPASTVNNLLFQAGRILPRMGRLFFAPLLT
ncbi:hypothetical protein VTN31DRAFT_3128 [Thermomyces dupontii]|uniref:uncharacterized protein n=1 Tax=Talaromyces thermophilus TaxID=28565 RepID=UPI0037429E98